MPKTYGATRKINLGRYGLAYEALDISIEGVADKSELMSELNDWRQQIHAALTPLANDRLQELNAKAKLTFKEDDERKELARLMNEPPF